MATYPSDGSPGNIQTIHDSQASNGDTITLPLGSFNWTARVNLTKGIILQGAGAISATNGGSGLTGTDQTTIVNRLSGSGEQLVNWQVLTGQTARLTGIRFLNDTSPLQQGGMIQVSGGSNCIRIDHCHLQYTVATGNAPFDIAVYGSVTGVIDHNYFDNALGNGPVGLYPQNGGPNFGDPQFSAPDDWGTDKFIFMEDNRWRNGYLGDANLGGQRFVLRYNTGVMEFDDAAHVGWGYFANHGLTPSRNRSSRAYEFYKNVMGAQAPGLNKSPFPINGGTGIIWGNVISQYRYITTIDYTRKDDQTYPYNGPPGDWGNCNGTTGTVWDGTGAPGAYPAIDQPGRGQGDLLSGNFPNAINTRTGTPAQCIQAKSPIYVFNNTLNPAGYSPTPIVGVNGPAALIQANREFYMQFGPNGTPGTFNGTVGCGEGLLSARPATCTTGVGYWATDTQTLYVASATNTWSVYYQPFTYPHPLQGGGPVTTKIISLSGNLDFGSVIIGEASPTATLTVSNSGNTVLTVTSISYPTGFTGNTSAFTVPAGGSSNVTVTFTPLVAQVYGGTITVTSDATTGNNTITCSGTGVIPTPPIHGHKKQARDAFQF